MCETMNNEVKLLLESYNRIDSGTVSLTRCLILSLLSYFVDGIQYRELKAALKISDGKLIANLNTLRETQYIDKFETEMDNSKIDIYILTEKGKSELNKIINWMELIKKVAKVEEKSCQVNLTK